MSKYTYVKFTNISNKAFDQKYDDENYTIKAGETQYYPPFLAKFMAKKLADREMIREHGKPMLDDPMRNAFLLKCLDIDNEIKLDNLKSMSLKDEIERQQKDMESQGLIPDEDISDPEPVKKKGRPHKNSNDDVEFEGSTATASNKIISKIPSV
jgi:hypothetical protein